VFLKQILQRGFKSAAIIGLGKNTGKTFTFNRLADEAKRLGLTYAVTSSGLDGEKQDGLLKSPKPEIVIGPGRLVVNAKSLLLASGLDYEILAVTDVRTPFGPIAVVRAKSWGKTVLAGPQARGDLLLLKNILGKLGCDFLLVDGAVDRRSLAAPAVTDTAVLAVGVEAAWDRQLLLEKVRQQYRILTLPRFLGTIGSVPPTAKAVILRGDGSQAAVTEREFFAGGKVLARHLKRGARAIYINGALTDKTAALVLSGARRDDSFKVVAADPTHVFLSREGWRRLQARGAFLQVLRPIHLSAVTVNPQHSSFGYADPRRLVRDIGREVHPIPCFDLNLGLSYVPEGG